MSDLNCLALYISGNVIQRVECTAYYSCEILGHTSKRYWHEWQKISAYFRCYLLKANINIFSKVSYLRVNLTEVPDQLKS